MIVLVTGATGFVGRAVAKALSSTDATVRCLVRTPGNESVLSGQNLDIHYGNVSDQAALRSALYDVDVVIHLVAVIRQSKKATFESVNRRGTENVVAAAVEAGVKQFIYISAIGAVDNPVYGYLHSKWQAEQAVITSGLPYTIIRPSIQFGEGDEFINSLAGLVRALPFVPIFGPRRSRYQPVAVGDVARCIAASVDNEDLKGKVIEIGGPDQLSYSDMIDIILDTYQIRKLKLHIPMPVVRLFVRLMEALLPRPPATSEQLRMMAIPNVAKQDTVEGLFDFKPRPLAGNIEYIKAIGFLDGLRIALGAMPTNIRRE